MYVYAHGYMYHLKTKFPSPVGGLTNGSDLSGWTLRETTGCVWGMWFVRGCAGDTTKLVIPLVVEEVPMYIQTAYKNELSI